MTMEFVPMFISSLCLCPALAQTLTCAVGNANTGLKFAEPLSALPVGVCDRDVLKAYKEEMDQVLHVFPEGEIVQAIASRPENQILDQEIAFQETGESRDKIDLCFFDSESQKLGFAEVKRIDDPRLKPIDGRPAVLNQLQNYSSRLKDQRSEILETYQRVAAWKRELELEILSAKIRPRGPSDLLERPILVIGNCTSLDVRSILDSVDPWGPLMAGLRDVAAGLILCGSDGCTLKLANGRQSIVF